MPDVGQQLSSVPFGDLIISLGMGIAEAQVELDLASAAVAQMMSGVNEADRVMFGGQKLSLIELGFTPTFYQFIESTIEVKMVISMRYHEESSVNVQSKSTQSSSNFKWWRATSQVQASSQTVDAKFARTYDYSAEGSSLIRTKMVPVPPPPILEERVRLLMEEEEVARSREGLIKIRAVLLRKIPGFNPAPDAGVFSVRDMILTYFAANPPEFNPVESIPFVLADPELGNAFMARYDKYWNDQKDRINDLLKGSTKWLPPVDGGLKTEADVRAYFFNTFPSLDIRKAGIPANTGELDFSRQINYVLIVEELKTWEPTDAQKAARPKNFEKNFFDAIEAKGLDDNDIKGNIKDLALYKSRVG